MNLSTTGDHPKTAEAIARKINLILGETRETLAAKTGRPVEEIYDDEADAVVVHGDDIDGLQGWQWDQSMFIPIRLTQTEDSRSSASFREARNSVRTYFSAA